MVLLFYVVITFSGYRQNADALARQKNILLLSKLAASSELDCAFRSNCIDSDKALALKNTGVFKTYWELAGLRIEKLRSNMSAAPKECSSGNYPNCESITLLEPKANTIQDQSFVSLCRQEYENNYYYTHCDIGVIKVWTEKKFA